MIGGISGQLAALAMESRGVRANASEAEIENAHEKHDEAVAAAEEAARQAAEAAEDGGFWDDVASVAGDVALVAGCVAAVAVTGGAASVVIIAAASMKLGGRALEEAGVDSELTGGMQLVGGLGLAVGGCMTGGGAVSMLSQGAGYVGAGATATQGASTGVSGKYKKDTLDHQTDGTAAMGRAGLADVDGQEALGEMKRAVKDDLALEAAARDIETQIQKHKSKMISQIGGA